MDLFDLFGDSKDSLLKLWDTSGRKLRNRPNLNIIIMENELVEDSMMVFEEEFVLVEIVNYERMRNVRVYERFKRGRRRNHVGRKEIL